MGEYRDLVEFVAGLTYDRLPAEVVARAKLHVMDFTANILAGAQLEEGRRIADYSRNLDHGQEASVLSFGLKTSRAQAAMANGTLGALLQSHDGFKHGGNHPSSSVIPAALALAEHRDLSGQDLITAVVAGYELANRISASIHPSHSLKGFAPTATVGTFAAAGAAAKLLRLSPDHLAQALGIAGFILPMSLYETLLGKYSVTPIHGGFAAKTGIEAALLAQAGYKGMPDPLQGEFNKGFCVITSDDFEPRKLSQGLGQDFAIMNTYFKPYPACRHTHGAVEVVLNWLSQEEIDWQEVDRVEVAVFAMAMQFVQHTEPGAELYQCQMSIPYVLAALLRDREMSFRQFSQERRQDPELHSFSRKIKVFEDPELTRAYPEKTTARVELILKNGRRLKGKIDHPGGDPGNPMSPEQLKAKARNNCLPALGHERTREFLDMVADLEKITHMGGLISLLG